MLPRLPLAHKGINPPPCADTAFVVTSRYLTPDRPCIRSRLSPLRALSRAAYVMTSDRHPDAADDALHAPAATAMRGLHGSRSGSRDSKQRFVLWAAHSRYSYIWHFEDDTLVDAAALSRLHGTSDADVISAEVRESNAFHLRRCPLCNARNSTGAFAWPAIRISKRFAVYLYQLSLRERGHHEPLSFVACLVSGCQKETLRNASVILNRNRREHAMGINRDRGAFVHPVKCRYPYGMLSLSLASSRNATLRRSRT